jgi:hypothetical protein
MPPSTSDVRDALLERAWSQWTALGVDATAEPDDGVVDPEALIALTAELGDVDARLRDLSTDWCVRYGRYVNGTRLSQVVRELETPRDAIGEYVATVAAAGGPTWPMATSARRGYVRRDKARLQTAATRSRLRIRLRAAFGVNVRADVLAALLAAAPEGRKAADLARAARSSKPSVGAALEALVLADLVTVRSVGNERRYALPAKVQILAGLRPPVPQVDWVSVFGVALRVARFESVDYASATVRAIEARRLVDSLIAQVASEHMPAPRLGELGIAFGAEFDRWTHRFSDWLRAAANA